MTHLLLYYQRPEPATWVFLSSFLLFSVYFVFHRFFCVRNLDIVLLVLLAPGLMMVYEGRKLTIATRDVIETENLAAMRERKAPQSNRLVKYQPNQLASGASSVQPDVSSAAQLGASEATNSPAPGAVTYPPVVDEQAWTARSLEFYGFGGLLLACAFLMIRMLIDPILVRRPLLIPNLTIGGLSFIGISLFAFLMANVITSSPRDEQARGPQLGPGYALLNMLPQLPTLPEQQQRDQWPAAEADEDGRFLPNIARILAIVSNMAIVLGIVGVGYWHFNNVKTGIGCAVMYLLLPYSAQMTGNLEHVMPAAFLILALLAYRQPLIAGLLLGFAGGLVYYPLFLCPLWFSFYWKRGIGRLVTGVGLSLIMLAGLLLLEGWEAFGDHLRWMFGLWTPRMEGLEGIWAPGGFPAEFRLPVLVGFILLSVAFAIWPSRKNLGSLMCGTAAVMLAAQFWHGNGGGLFMAWFLPFALLTIFRPNLDDRIATIVVSAQRKSQ